MNLSASKTSELRAHNIPIFQFPTEDETVRDINEELNKLVPFAVVGSTDFVKGEDEKLVRVRRYLWGVVEVENEDHCDFVKLREAVLRTNVDNLRERTHKVLYETYRKEHLRSLKVGEGDTGLKMLQAIEQKHGEFAVEMDLLDKSMREELHARISKADDELQRKEEALNNRMREITRSYEEETQRINSQIRTLTEEKSKLEAKSKKYRK